MPAGYDRKGARGSFAELLAGTNPRRQKQSIKELYEQVIRIVSTGFHFVVCFLREGMGLLAASAGTEPDDESDLSSSALRGGILNYGTGQLDDGTDPAGWYEDD